MVVRTLSAASSLAFDIRGCQSSIKYCMILTVHAHLKILLLTMVQLQKSSAVAVVGRQKGGGRRSRQGKGSVGHTVLSARHAKGYLNVPHDSKYTGRKRKTKF
jgi:Methyltransferase involved in Williams-Beuren syndrome